MQKRMASVVACALAAAASAALGNRAARAVDVVGDKVDYEAQRVVSDGSRVVDRPTNGVLRAGVVVTSSVTRVSSPVYFFQLPDAAAAGDVSAANLSLFYVLPGQSSGNPVPPPTPTANLDLYGLGYVHGAVSQTGNYHFEGADDSSAPGVNIPNVVKIQDNFLTPASALNARYDTDATGDANLKTFLQDLYGRGAVAGDFAVLRLNFDAAATDTSQQYHYELGGGDRTIADQLPILSVTVTPEPTGVALAGVALCGLLGVRGRRR